jgi:valyl-tRNA synthetase
MPFVTEEIWSALADVAPDAVRGEELLIRASWPAAGSRDAAAEHGFDELATLIRGLRNLRTDAGAPAGAWLPMRIDPADQDAASRLRAGAAYVETLARVRPIEIGADGERPPSIAPGPLGAAWLEIDASDNAERRDRQLAELDANIERVRSLLANEAFVARAPEAVVARERERLATLEAERAQLDGT